MKDKERILHPVVRVIIPAFNEENGIAQVLKEIPSASAYEVIVVNNASTDRTETIAKQMGATVLREPIAGYGRACLKGIRYLVDATPPTDVVVFLDADYSDYPEELDQLIRPILENGVDLVIGSRALGKPEKGSMTTPQIFGNWLATRLLWLLYDARFTDLGPFRAIRYDKLIALNMRDTTYGWTVEMQLKAARNKLICKEIPVRYRKRVGFSKISGTIRGTILAGYKIIYTILRYAVVN